LAERPPVNAMPRPILMGFALSAVADPTLERANAMPSTAATARNVHQRLKGLIIDPLSSL
jgi:hypothetical protein